MTRHTALLATVVVFALESLAAEVRLTVEEPSGVARQAWPVTAGVPIGQGALRDAETAVLFSAEGKEVPLQTEVLARWPDGSVRWLLLDFQADLPAGGKNAYRLQWDSSLRRGKVAQPVLVEKTQDVAVLNPGPIRVEIAAKRFSLKAARIDDGERGKPKRGESTRGPEVAAGIELVDARGRKFDAGAGPADVIVEQCGPLRACVRIAGHHANSDGRMFAYVLRMHAFRGQPFLRGFYTFVNDYQDSLMAKLQQLSLAFHLTTPASRGGQTDATPLSPSGRVVGSSARKTSASPSPLSPSGRVVGGEGAGDPVHVILDGKLQPGPTHRLFQIDERQYQLDGAPAGTRAAGWAALGTPRLTVAVGLREFWQNWPKAIDVGGGQLRLDLCPEVPAGLYAGKPLEEENKLYYWLRDGLPTFKVGVARTHEFWLALLPAASEAAKLSSLFRAAEEPLLATCEPQYACSTKAAGEMPPADPKKFARYDAWLSRALEANLRLRDRDREYGMLNFGDWYGERRVNWGNLEYDLAHGLFLQYLRTGERRYWLRAEQAARHHIDVDVIHAVNPHLKNPWGQPPKVGEIWLHCLNHTGGYYLDAPLPVERTYQMGHSTNFGHVWVSGDLDYYLLTGDRRAREVSIDIADAMAAHCPTAYSDHIRGMGWPMVLVLAAYDATGDRKYLEAATKNWQVLKKNLDPERGWVVRLAKGHCLHEDRRCHGNVPFMEGLTLSALARYHRITGDPEVLKAMSVGIDQMIRECWDESSKSLRYTACPLTSKAPMAIFLSAEAMAYESALTGNQEHRRILREGARAVLASGGSGGGKGLAQVIFFAPHGLGALEDLTTENARRRP